MPFKLYYKGKITPYLVKIQLESTYKGNCTVVLDISDYVGKFLRHQNLSIVIIMPSTLLAQLH